MGKPGSTYSLKFLDFTKAFDKGDVYNITITKGSTRIWCSPGFNPWPFIVSVYVNDLPEKSTTSSVALFADDTKCYHAIRTTDDVKALQCDLDGISQWCRTRRMNLNETKCGVPKVTRNLKPVQSSYHLNNDNSANSTVICKRLVQKDLGVLITADLKWNQQVSAVCAKANRMLG
ncbi:Hypothetical predicted protein, partial [Paramuricea clavata]